MLQSIGYDVDGVEKRISRIFHNGFAYRSRFGFRRRPLSSSPGKNLTYHRGSQLKASRSVQDRSTQQQPGATVYKFPFGERG